MTWLCIAIYFEMNSRKPTPIYVILHEVRSAHNVGSIFRTADGAGVKKIYLCGYTPSPVDRFGREQPEIKKTSLSATESVPWEHYENIHDLLLKLKEEGIRIVGVEQHADALTYANADLLGPTTFIFGNEIDGVSENILEKLDAVIHIPMYGAKESLNVAVAAGIILFSARSHTL